MFGVHCNSLQKQARHIIVKLIIPWLIRFSRNIKRKHNNIEKHLDKKNTIYNIMYK